MKSTTPRIEMQKRTFLTAMVLLFLTVAALGQKRGTSPEFESFLEKLDDSQVELQNGKADAFKSMWSQSDDITLSGGFGGTIERGWPAISKRLDWVSANFSKGKNSIERMVTHHDAKFGYVVQLEHISFVAPETGKSVQRDFRVTMIFRREKAGWRLVHRQADSQFTKEAPR